MGPMASQITSLTIVYSTIHSDVHQRKHQSPTSLAFVQGIHRWPVNSPHKVQVTRKCFHLMTSSWKWCWITLWYISKVFDLRVLVNKNCWKSWFYKFSKNFNKLNARFIHESLIKLIYLWSEGSETITANTNYHMGALSIFIFGIHIMELSCQWIKWGKWCRLWAIEDLAWTLQSPAPKRVFQERVSRAPPYGYRVMLSHLNDKHYIGVWSTLVICSYFNLALKPWPTGAGGQPMALPDPQGKVEVAWNWWTGWTKTSQNIHL